MERLRQIAARLDWTMFQHYVSLGYNCSQVVAWLFVFMWQLPKDLPLLSPSTYLNIMHW